MADRGVITDVSLHVKEVTETDRTGIVQCTCTRGQGTDILIFHVEVADAPRVGDDLVVTIAHEKEWEKSL